MEEMIAVCGMMCTKCPVYRATQANDDAARDQVVEQWTKQYGMSLTRGDINCDGCKADSGRLFGHCQKCSMRSCADEKSLSSCALCTDYPCKDLEAFHQMVPIAKRTLEKMPARTQESN